MQQTIHTIQSLCLSALSHPLQLCQRSSAGTAPGTRLAILLSPITPPSPAWALAQMITLPCPLSPAVCPQSCCFPSEEKLAPGSIPDSQKYLPRSQTWKACTALNSDTTKLFVKSSVVLFCLFDWKETAQLRHMLEPLALPPAFLSLAACFSSDGVWPHIKAIQNPWDQKEHDTIALGLPALPWQTAPLLLPSPFLCSCLVHHIHASPDWK